MKIKIGIFMLFFVLCTVKAYAVTGRDLIIQKELDCMDEHQNDSLSWSDVCSLPDSSENSINAAPIITSQPLSQVVTVPETATFTIEATGSPSYQWMESIDGGKTFTAILGANGDSYTTIPTELIDSGSQFECVLTNASGTVTSDPVTLTVNPSPVSNGRVNTFDLSQQLFYSHFSDPQKVRKVTGVWAGVEGKYIFRPPVDNIFDTPVFNYYAIEGLYATGKNAVDKDEERNDGTITKLVLKNIPGSMDDDRLLLGRDFIPMPTLRLTPYTGFGVRYKTDQGSNHFNIVPDGGDTGLAYILDYNRSYIYYYIPTGLTFDLVANHDYEASLNMEYDYLIRGYERDDYSNFDNITESLGSVGLTPFSNQNLRYTLNHGWGGRTSLKLLKHFSLVDIYLEPYIRYWDIKPSKIASGYVGGGEYINAASKNSTLEIGSSLGVQF